MPVIVPSVQGYVLTTPSASVNVASVQGYLLTNPQPVPVWASPFATTFLAAVNKQFGTSFTAAMLSFGAPSVLSGDDNYNTTVTITAKRTSGYSGTKTVRYLRFPLSRAFVGKDFTALPTLDTTIYKSLTAINAKYGLSLTTDDVVDGAIASGATFVNLTAKAGSYYFLADSVQRIGTQIPTMAQAFPQTEIFPF